MSKNLTPAHAVFLEAANDLEGAFTTAYRALTKDPEDWGVVEALAYCFMRAERWPVAYHLLQYVRTKIGPAPELLTNIAMNCASIASASGIDEYLVEGEHLLRKADAAFQELGNDKGRAAALANLALTLVNRGEAEAGEAAARASLRIDPNNHGCYEALGFARLLQGDWEEGFKYYEFNMGDKYRKFNPPNGEPYWDGTKGLKLHIRGDQGIGDEISYASVVPDAARDCEIVYECEPRLAGLFRRSFPNVDVRGTRFEPGPTERKFDAHCLTSSLCRFYRKKDEDFPRKGFLIPDPERVVQWKALLDTLPGKKVGIAWSGGNLNTFHARRSVGLEGMLPILKIPGVTFISLQYLDPTPEIAMVKAKHGIEVREWARATSKSVDYDETAALVSNLDAVVTTTTAIAHLCGGLGKKAHVLVPKNCRWFYQSDSAKHRWYDSLELHRQQNEWPVEAVAKRLAEDLHGA